MYGGETDEPGDREAQLGMMLDQALRVGYVPYLNGQPLTAWLEGEGRDRCAERMAAVPSRLAALLESGALDVALVSSIEAFRRPDAVVISGMSISADGPVRSVRLFANVPFEMVRTLAADEGSLTSVALAGIVLRERYGADTKPVAMEPGLQRMLAECDAALLIGDRAMEAPAAPYMADLGAAWKELTGLPFVYAAWLARDETLASIARPLLLQSLEWGLANRQRIARQWAERTCIMEPEAQDYLHNIMQYDLDVQKREALDLFREMCSAHGLVERTYPVRYA